MIGTDTTTDPARAQLRRSASGARHTAMAYGLAVAVTFVTLAIRVALSSDIDSEPALIIFLLPVLLSAYIGGFGPGLVATLLGAAGARYFLLNPEHSFALTKPIDEVRLALLVLAGILASILNEMLHRARRRAAEAMDSQTRILAKIAARAPGLVYAFRQGHDGSSHFEYVSPGIEEICGIHSDALRDGVGRVLGLLDPESARAVLASYAAAARAHTPWRYELRFTTRDAVEHWFECNAVPEIEPDGSTLWCGIVTDTTDRKRAEQALYLSEERFRLAMRGATDGLWDWDLQSDAVYYSPRWKSMLGYEEHELEAHVDTWKRLIHPDDVGPALFKVEDAVKGRSAAYEAEFRMRHKDGHYVKVLARGLVVRNAAGRALRLVGTHLDITERYQSEERYRALIETSFDAIWEVDSAGRWTFMSPKGASLRGYAADELCGHTTLEFMPSDEALRLGKILAEITLQRLPFTGLRYTALHKDGRRIVLESSGVPVIGPNGEFQGYRGNDRDVTARQQAEEELRLSRAQLLAALEAGGMGTWVWDLEKDVLWWDDASLAIWGRSRAEIGAGHMANIVSFVNPEDFAGIVTSTEPLIRGTTDELVAEHRVLRLDGGERWVLSKGRVDRDQTGRPRSMTGIYLDITERKQMEESQLRTQKLEALGTLAGGIAHDFNNILLAISGNTRLAADDVPSDHPAQKSLREIAKASRRATDVVRRILAFGRGHEPKREIVELRPIVEEALELLRPTLPATIGIGTELAGDVPPVAADASQIQQIIVNLATNAAHAIGAGGGRICLRLQAVDVDAESARATPKLQAGRYARLDVSDTGSGMDAATMARIFDPFFTTKPVGQGTGLGLSVVHGIMQGYGGAVSVHSTVGQGSTFELYFPAAGAAVAPAQAGLRPAQRGRGERVLYVDDDEMLVVLIARVLGNLGYQVEGCSDPREALRRFRDRPHEFDVVVSDLAMPGLPGFKLVEELRRVRADVPVLLTTGYARPEDEARAQALGVRAVILKPNTVNELGDELVRLFQQTGDA
ncbi:MAG: PAS domain S-box protein [Deltaproteobacteria bacterium]|nr:PAS domain S-box protein [Deltaproteobacteria bacterium]